MCVCVYIVHLYNQTSSTAKGVRSPFIQVLQDASEGASDPKPYTPLLATAPAVTADGYLAALREAGIAFIR